MSLVPRKQHGFKIPLQTIVIGDFDEAVKRIKEVKFLPDRIIVETVASFAAIKTSLLMLRARIVGVANGQFYVTERIKLSDWHYDEDLIYFSPDNKFFSIPLRNAGIIVFTDGVKTKAFAKK